MKRAVLTLTACLVALCSQALPVDSSTARRAAGLFLEHALRLKCDDGLVERNWAYDGMYLFTFGQGGFVVVSADDAARPVLAYSADGAFDPASPSATLQSWLDTYEAEIAMAVRDSLPTDPAWARLLSGKAVAMASKDLPSSVGPLVATQWGQYAPYNGMCPSGVPSGCVATAMSQVMRFWNYPAFGQGSHSYNCATFGNLGADFAHTRYDWANMPETGGSSATERTALATLTFHVGVSVNMDYNYTQSGATTGGGDNCALEALRRYFHYNADDISYHSKGSTPDSAWADFLRQELRQMRPIMYDGTAGAFGGHSFICDGYDSLGLFHFNLGEFGEGDGYYAIGGITYRQYNLNGNNAAITGIHPEYGLYVSDTAVTYHRSGGESEVWVMTCDTSDAPWTATASDDWIALGNTDFDHLGAMTVTLSENTTGSERTGTVTLRQGTLAATITVRQAAFDENDYCTLTVLMESTRNQAWSDGAHLSFESPDGLVYATAAHTANGSSSTQTVSVAPHDVLVRWIAGGPLDRYYNYVVVGPSGDTLVKVSNAYYNGSDTLISFPCSPLAIDPLTADDGRWTVAPNPAIDHVDIGCDQPIHSVTVTDLSGRTVHAGTGNRIDSRAWPAGVYIVRVVTERGASAKRILKQ